MTGELLVALALVVVTQATSTALTVALLSRLVRSTTDELTDLRQRVIALELWADATKGK